MAKQKGSDMLLKVDTTGGGNYVTVGGIQSSRFSIRKDAVDVTNQLSTNKMRELLEGAGITQISVSGSGTMDSAAPASTLRSMAMAGTIRNWQVIVPGEGTFQGLFQITQYERNAPHDKDVTFDISLESGGDIAFS